MKLPDSFLEELRARTPLAALVSRRVKLSRSGRHSKGCCPFHNEKTPSFYVYEDGYHCFGCGAHGDAISFVMQAQGASFMEAVQSLAGEAGLDLPKASPQAEEAERRRLDLHDVLEAAQTFYRTRLAEKDGAAALAYLRNRGLSDQTIARFGLGWSGEGRGLAASLPEATPAQLLEAGLLRPAEDGSPGRELFFNRVMFPIRDRRGRIISFGGRTLGDAQPKYVNGPETPLFSKRRTLYGLDLAREAARGGAPVIAVEGYMDVIALHQAGFPGAVAPLGTALTLEQLHELWKLSPNPILCLDGDAAGARAAARATVAALPELLADRSLSVVTLPVGDDPDSMLRRGDTAAFRRMVEAPPPLVDSVFFLMQEGLGELSSSAPLERWRTYRAKLEAAAASINDRPLASLYKSALLTRFFEAWNSRAKRPRGSTPQSRSRLSRPKPPIPVIDAAQSGADRERFLAAILIRHPNLLHDVEEAWCSLSLPAPLARLRHALVAYLNHLAASVAAVLDSASLTDHLRSLGLAAEISLALDGAPSCARPDALPLEAEAGWWHFYGLMHRSGLEDAVREAHLLYQKTPDAPSLDRLNKLCIARDRLRRGEQGLEGSEWGEPELDVPSA